MARTFYVGTRKGFFSIARSPRGWAIEHAAFLGVQVPMVLHDPRDGAIYAGLNHGHFGHKVHRSTDGGKTWAEIGSPTFPPKPADAPMVKCPMRGIEIPWSVQLIWALEIDPATPGGLWCGTVPGALFHSSDRGQSWQLVESLWNEPARAKWMGGGYDYPGIHSILVDPRDANRIHLGISCGGVWGTFDHGKTWSQRAHGMRNAYSPPEQAYEPDSQDAHLISQCAGQPDVMWSQHHNGIFVTTDGSKKWREIENVSPSVFGFTVAVHPRDGATAWFVPAIKDEVRVPVDGKMVVTRTRDGGGTFATLSEGLPQDHAYDLVYRHGLDIAEDGNTLAMGSTTGSLWVSEDQGDSWQTVSANLPPVFAVKFKRGR